jgi:tellurite resistance protein
MIVDTPLMRVLRDHLLELAPLSIRPRDPAGRAAAESPEEAAILERFYPFAELLFLVAGADGQVDPKERSATLGAFVALTDGRLPRSTLERVERAVVERARRDGWEQRLHRVCSDLAADRDDAELAFTLATAVALSDDVTAEAELVRLASIAEALGISPRRMDLLLAGSLKSEPPPKMGR